MKFYSFLFFALLSNFLLSTSADPANKTPLIELLPTQGYGNVDYSLLDICATMPTLPYIPYTLADPANETPLIELLPTQGYGNYLFDTCATMPTLSFIPYTLADPANETPLIELLPTQGDGNTEYSIELQVDVPTFSDLQSPNNGSDPDGPVVMNVTAQQAGDLVNVSYSLTNLPAGPDNTAFVAAWFSTNGGEDWNPCSSLFGSDHGPGVSAGLTKNFIWDAKADSPDTATPEAIIRIIATSGETTGGFMGPGNLADSPEGTPTSLSSYKIYEIDYQTYMTLTEDKGFRKQSEFPAFVFIADQGGWQIKSVLRSGGPDGLDVNINDNYFLGPTTSSWTELIDPSISSLFTDQASIVNWFSNNSITPIGTLIYQ